MAPFETDLKISGQTMFYKMGILSIYYRSSLNSSLSKYETLDENVKKEFGYCNKIKHYHHTNFPFIIWISFFCFLFFPTTSQGDWHAVKQ